MKILQKDNYHLKYNFKAFTLAEMLIVIFVFLAIGSLFFYRFLNISLDYNYLKTDMEIIQEVLMKAKQKSILAENNLSWGVYFENTTTDKFYLFWGNKFSTSSIFEQYLLNSNNKFISPQEGSSTEVVLNFLVILILLLKLCFLIKKILLLLLLLLIILVMLTIQLSNVIIKFALIKNKIQNEKSSNKRKHLFGYFGCNCFNFRSLFSK